MSSLSPAEVRVIVIGALLALFLSALDQTIVATALPPIAADLGGFTLISWVVTAYLLTSTCITPIVGKLSDLYGRRRILNLSLIVFMIGSALSALAPSMPLLILFRAIQGLAAAGCSPSARRSSPMWSRRVSAGSMPGISPWSGAAPRFWGPRSAAS